MFTFSGESSAIGKNPAVLKKNAIKINATNLILSSWKTQIKILAWSIWPENVARNTDFSSFTFAL